MEFVEPEDEHNPFGRPLPPDDRLWRHPSEWKPPAAGEPARSRPVWPVALTSALMASVVSVSLVVALGGLTRRRSGDQMAIVERQMVTPAATSSAPEGTSEPVRQNDLVVELAERTRPAIAQVRVGRDPARTGSAVMFRSDGHLLTNAHLVEDADEITVVLASGKAMTGRVLGADPDTDAAVVKIEGGPFSVATLGTASSLRVGQRAVAIGSPSGASGTPSVTVGVVSGLHREVRSRTDNRLLFDMVQTDAPIAPGSSGGALLDDVGSVVGITTAIAGDGDFGFATPIDVAKSVSEQLIAHGRARAVWLGVQGGDVDGDTAKDLGLEGGALVADVMSGSPADRGGMTGGDVIVGLDDRPVDSMGDLVAALRTHEPGDTVTVAYVREGEELTARAVLAERPSDE